MPAEMKGAQKGFVCLQVKPSARLAYSFIPGTARSGKNPQLLVFLGGIDSSQKGWQGAFAKLMSLSEAAGVALPPMLAYDRYGVGASDQDPSDDGKPPEEYHDTRESMRDLRALITLFAREQLGLTEGKLQDLRIVFCAHSLGCCIARHYAEAYPGTVEAVLFIDSAIAGTAAEKLVPDPDIPDEWKARKWMVPEGTTEDHCRRAVRRAKQSHFSGYALTTKEKIRWDHMPKLLPLGSEPRLRGPNARLPLVTVLISDDTIMTPLLAKVRGYRLR